MAEHLDPGELLEDLEGFNPREFAPLPQELTDEGILARIEASTAYTAFRDIYHYDVHPQPHLEAAEFIDAAMGDYKFTGDRKLYMIGWPRHTYKTTLFAQGLPSLVLGKNPDARILIDAHRHDVSKRRLRAVKRDLESNPRFHARFGDGWKPEFREDVWNEDSIYVMRRSESLIDPSIATAGVDRSMTGAHFDFIIADDLVTDRNILTSEMRQKVYDHILDLLPILSPTGVLILIFTRWHVDDAYGRLIRIDQQRARRGKDPFFVKTIHQAWNKDGTLFFPAVLTEQFLADQREQLGSRKFAAQYLNEPVADEDRTFAMDLARIRAFDFMPSVAGGGYVRAPGLAQARVLNTMAWDPAGRKSSRRSDSHGFTVCGTDAVNRRWVIEAVGIKGKPSEIVNRAINLYLYYKPWAISVEIDGGGGLWIDLLRAEFDRRGIERPHIIEWSTGGVPKNERIATAVQPRWERGGYILKPEQHELLSQIESFSIAVDADHEDILDSLAQHESYAQTPDPWDREEENPIDPEYLARRKRLGSAAGEFAERSSPTATRWDIGGSSSTARTEVAYDGP